MRMAILMAMLAAMSGGAWAQQWVAVSENSQADFYVDPSKIRKNGNMRRFWQLIDAKPDQKGPGMSYRGLHEVDCKEERTRVLQLDWFSGRMASGQRLGGGTLTSDWDYVAPGTSDAAVMKFVCSR